jgi:hypothetical protein
VTDFGDIQGMQKALESLRNLGSEDRVFVRKSLRKAVRAGSKQILAAMRRLAPKMLGVTLHSLSARAIKKRKNQVADTIGAYGSLWDAGQKFYAGWVNFGHRIFSRKTAGGHKQLSWSGTSKSGREKSRRGAKSAGFVEGKLWTEPVKMNFDLAQQALIETLKAEIEGREWCR